MGEFNEAQKIIAAVYANGEFSHVKSINDASRCGDTLFEFLIRETAESEGCDSLEKSVRRLEWAQNDINDCKEAIIKAIGESESASPKA